MMLRRSFSKRREWKLFEIWDSEETLADIKNVNAVANELSSVVEPNKKSSLSFQKDFEKALKWG